MAKRPDGSLEHDILTILWDEGGPLPPAEIKNRLGTDLAYTSVATVLGRLQTKGLVTRTAAAGRGYAYEALVDRSQFAAQRINQVLAAVDDRDAALMSFVGGLSKRDRKALRSLLGDQPA
jgi:predicted transcriptional regulator